MPHWLRQGLHRQLLEHRLGHRNLRRTRDGFSRTHTRRKSLLLLVAVVVVVVVVVVAMAMTMVAALRFGGRTDRILAGHIVLTLKERKQPVQDFDDRCDVCIQTQVDQHAATDRHASRAKGNPPCSRSQ